MSESNGSNGSNGKGAVATAVPVTTRKDWSSDQEVRWCPGCGDYSILAAVQMLMPEVVQEDGFWRMMIELIEIVLHRRGYVVARREHVRMDLVAEEVKRDGWYARLWQSFAVLLPIQSVGVMGDERTYENVLAVRAVSTTDFMTADWYRMPHNVLDHIARRVVNEVRGVNRVVYDISSKPPSTIEWE